MLRLPRRASLPERYLRLSEQLADMRREREDLRVQRDRLCAAIRDFIDARAALMNASEQGREWADEKNAYNRAEDAIFAAYDAAMASAALGEPPPRGPRNDDRDAGDAESHGKRR